jgi:hypothetical protein
LAANFWIPLEERVSNPTRPATKSILEQKLR